MLYFPFFNYLSCFSFYSKEQKAHFKNIFQKIALDFMSKFNPFNTENCVQFGLESKSVFVAIVKVSPIHCALNQFKQAKFFNLFYHDHLQETERLYLVWLFEKINFFKSFCIYLSNFVKRPSHKNKENVIFVRKFIGFLIGKDHPTLSIYLFIF